MNKFYLQKNVLYLSQLLPKFPWCRGQMRFIDKSLQILLSTGWVPGLLVSIILFCYRLLKLPTACEGSVNNPKQAVKHPWNTREPPVNHPWTTREPPVNHPWTTRDTSVNHPWDECVRDSKTWVRDLKNGFCTMSDPWNTREATVKHPWSTREASVNDPGTRSEHALTGKLLPSLQGFPISNTVCHSAIFEDNACLYEPSFSQNRFKTVMVLKFWQQVIRIRTI